MTVATNDYNRETLPIWRPSSSAGEETHGLSHPGRDFSSARETLIRLVAEAESDVDRLDAYFLAVNIGARDAAVRLAHSLRDFARSRPVLQALLASSLGQQPLSRPALGLPHSEQVKVTEAHGHVVGSAIRSLRHSLRMWPHQAFGWLDLARLQTILGNRRAARRAIDVAWQLGKSNRFIARSVARFHMHDERQDLALLRIRERSKGTTDPWLISAEASISAASGERSETLGRGLREIRNQNHAARDLSELAAVVSTEELRAGRRWKKVRRIVAPGLEDLNDNSVAQFAWLARHNHLGSLPRQVASQLSRSNEAVAWTRITETNASEARFAAAAWLMEEPFSSRPAALLGGIVGDWEEDYQTAASIIGSSLNSKPTSFTLRNNHAYYLAHTGQQSLAKLQLDRAVPESTSEEVVRTATLGLINFRSDAPARGRLLYTHAVQLAAEQVIGSTPDRLTIAALLHWAKEESRARKPGHERIVQHALRLSAQIGGDNPFLVNLRHRLKEGYEFA